LKSSIGKKEGFDARLMDMQDRLQRVMGCESIDLRGVQRAKHSVEDDAPADLDGSKTLLLRQTEWYGINCEDWLNLVVKVSLIGGAGHLLIDSTAVF
jgi:hypothetical protein